MFQASNMTYMRRREAEKKVVLQTIHRHQLVFCDADTKVIRDGWVR